MASVSLHANRLDAPVTQTIYNMEMTISFRTYLVPMAGVDKFVWNKFGHAQHARRAKTRDGFRQPGLHKYTVPVPFLNSRNKKVKYF